MSKIFLSHINKEADLARTFKDWIEGTFAGQYEVFVSSDRSSNPLGTRWLDNMDNALNESKAFIVLCSPYSLRRPWINFETGCGWSKQVPVIPICHSGQEVGELPMPISFLQGLQLEADSFIDDFFKSLSDHLGILKLPRIDKSQMRTELQSALQNIKSLRNDSVVVLSANSQQVQLEEIELDILYAIAVHRSDPRNKIYVPAETKVVLQSRFPLSPIKIDYYLDRFKQLELVQQVSIGGRLSYYEVTSKGRALLNERGRLD